jgi:phage shock protein E
MTKTRPHWVRFQQSKVKLSLRDSSTSLGMTRIVSAMTRFEKLVAEAKKNITEISPQEAAEKAKSGEAVIIDVREQDEWDEGHIRDGIHLSRGTIELDIEENVPDPNAMIICHCGGGGRSALAAESLQKMGYKNVRSMAGGLKAWKAAGLPTITAT